MEREIGTSKPDGDNEVGVTDALKVVAHWNIPGVISGTLGYDVIADVGPVLQYPTPGVISIVDAGVVSAHYREYVSPQIRGPRQSSVLKQLPRGSCPAVYHNKTTTASYHLGYSGAYVSSAPK